MKCSNPIQCQMAEREECSCACGGVNHGILRAKLISSDPAVVSAAQVELNNLRDEQERLKKLKSKSRRQRRDLQEKMTMAANKLDNELPPKSTEPVFTTTAKPGDPFFVVELPPNTMTDGNVSIYQDKEIIPGTPDSELNVVDIHSLTIENIGDELPPKTLIIDSET